MFRFERTDPAGGSIFFQNECVAEIENIRMGNIRFRPGGAIVIGMSVPVNLFWRQYINHEHPEHNAGSHGTLEHLESGEVLVLRCFGTNASRALESVYTLTVSLEETGKFLYEFDAELGVHAGCAWQVQPNPHHGEVEFFQLWPHGTFSSERNSVKHYDSCLIQQGKNRYTIPHHHLESSDKHNIEMRTGDSFAWVLEDENPTITILSDRTVYAGLCAYMWDGHFAYRADGDTLTNSTRFRARFLLSSKLRSDAEPLVINAQRISTPEENTAPIVVDGSNSFAETLRTQRHSNNMHTWPWTAEAGDDGVECDRCKDYGFDDEYSLHIRSAGGRGRWLATTLGPAFGQEPFPDSARYRLSTRISTRSLSGKVIIALRLHRSGAGEVYQIDSYEVFQSEPIDGTTADWEYLSVETPVISPEPDRMHLILELEGVGDVWFDAVLFEVLK